MITVKDSGERKGKLIKSSFASDAYSGGLGGLRGLRSQARRKSKGDAGT